jgi:predicted regulator of amino acid metabolism with ACT domain
MEGQQYTTVKNTVIEMAALGYSMQYDTAVNYCEDNLSKETINIRFVRFENNDFESTDVKIPAKKTFTTDYVLERISKKNKVTHLNLVNVFKTLRNKLNIRAVATSYGLGMEALFSNHESMHENANGIKEILNNYGIEYTTSVSEASWVYRFHISKKESNLNKIQSL